ncbi:MAG TPA: sulfurtransferase [Actinobacteria bacterium]|jgi:rhodanese-related sulfurtransferase|nr:sulfurtransferase [Actinomycetota bacterium]
MATIDELLRAARERLTRLSAEQVAVELAAGALVVDIRPFKQRREFGQIPGSLAIERNVLEWRLDPASESRIAAATSHEITVIVVCHEGYTSSLAAASLHDLGLRYATDLVGGVSAWKAAGLPVVEADSEE